MLIVENIVVANSSTNVPRVHLILRFTIETAFRKYRHWQGIRFVRISVQPRVAVADRSIVHSTESHCHVRVFTDLRRLCGRRNLVSTKKRHLYCAHWLIFQLCLKLEVDNIKVDKVVRKLVVNVER